jgi:hypothetical protein
VLPVLRLVELVEVPLEAVVPGVLPKPAVVLSLTRMLFWTCFAPDTDSAMSSARRRWSRLFTVPDNVTSPLTTDTSISVASTSQSSPSRSETSSRIRSSDRA